MGLFDQSQGLMGLGQQPQQPQYTSPMNQPSPLDTSQNEYDRYTGRLAMTGGAVMPYQDWANNQMNQFGGGQSNFMGQPQGGMPVMQPELEQSNVYRGIPMGYQQPQRNIARADIPKNPDGSYNSEGIMVNQPQAKPLQSFFEGPTKDQIPMGFNMVNGEMVRDDSYQPQAPTFPSQTLPTSTTPALNPTPQPPQMFEQPMPQTSNPVNTQTVQPNFLGQTPFGQPQTSQYSSSNPFVQAAQANAQGNLAGALQATAANRVNQQTPYGSLQYQQTGTDAQGNPIWSANQTVAQPYQNAINSLSGQIQQNFAQPFDTSQYQNQMVGSTPQFQGVGSAPQLGMISQNPQFQNVSSAQQALGTGSGPQFQGVGQAPNLQTSVQGTGMQGWDQATNLLMSRLNPQIKQQNEASDAQLANQGIMPGSEAYNRAKTQIAQQQNDLLNQAQLAGSQIQNQMFNQNLAAGTFGNTALGNQNTMNLGNTAFNNALGQQGFANQVTGTQLGNQAAQQNFTNQLAGTGFNNALGQQGFANQLAGTQANNAALGAQNTMNLGNTAFNNALSQQGFGNQLAGTAANNAARQANFGQGLTQYQLPTASLGSLRAATTPGYVTPYNQAAVAGPDYLSAYTSQNATDIARANAEAAQRSSLLSTLGGLGSSAILGGTGANSALGGLLGLGNQGLTALGNSSLWSSLFGNNAPAITGDTNYLNSIGLGGSTYGSGIGGMTTDPLAGYF